MTRSTPIQTRARNSIDFILEAAIQLLDSDDESLFTTNHLASRAGVSIGTVYRYFPDKRSVLKELVEREAQSYYAKIDELLIVSSARSPEKFILELMSLGMELFGGRPKASHNIRVLSRRDHEIMKMVQKARWEHTSLIYNHLRTLAPERFPPLSMAEIIAGCEAYLVAMIALSEDRSDKEVDIETRARLVLQFYEALPTRKK